MKLKLLNIDDFIKTRKVKQVTSIKIYETGKKNQFDQNGLFSENIFGRFGSRQRKLTFGYVNLKCKIIHPAAYSILTSLNPDLTKLILGKSKYVIDDDGLLISDEELGETGILHFIKNFNKLDFNKLVEKNEKNDHLDFINRYKENLLIDKFLIVPAGVRDIMISSKGSFQTMQHSELSSLYEKLIRQTNYVFGNVEDLPSDIISPVISEIQKVLKQICDWIIELLKGKQGLIRGGLLRKTTDYSARIVIAPDSSLKLGYVGIPWHFMLKLHEPFVIHAILNDDEKKKYIKESLKLNNLDVTDIKRTITNIVNDPHSVEPKLKSILLEVVEKTSKDKVVVYKRDPAENRNTWQSSYVRIDDTGYTMKLNPFDLIHNMGLILVMI